MTLDLLKEFGETQEKPWRQQLHVPGQQALEDDFGDFEKPGSNRPTVAGIGDGQDGNPNERAQVLTKISYHPGLDPLQDFDDEPGPLGSPKIESTWQWETDISRKDRAEDLGEFADGTVLFDAESEPPTENVTRTVAPSIQPLPPVDIDGHRFDGLEPINEDEIRAKALSPHPASLTAIEASKAPPTTSADLGPPPSNVPPPSILLSLSVTVVQESMQAIRSTPADSENDQSELVRRLLSNLRTIGRILAGRKNRWKRDTRLSQSMSIGQAGKQGGMKLTSVDKTENRKEDQEAAELLKTWRQHAGVLRVRLTSAWKLGMPEFAEYMPVRSGKPSEGAVSAPKPCFLCGLKRDERISKVDVKVEDSFGEWWVEHWGHVDCVRFWGKYEGSLRKR